jgi:undecaprenyl-diphosphatase
LNLLPPPAELPADGWRARVQAFDRWADDALDHLRGNPTLDRVFYAATELGDWAILWHLTGAARGLVREHGLEEAVRLSAVLGVESVLVNGVIKSLFRRTRPITHVPRAFTIRQPRTSSFPSGHASSAFTAAAVLSQGSAAWPLYYGAATVVAVSRAYVRIHHASDVVGGVATGIVLGAVARRVWPRP